MYICTYILIPQANYDQVLEPTLDIFRRKFEYFSSHISAMDELFEASFSTVADSGRLLSKCGKCSHYMKFIASRPQRLYCMTCEVTYSLPLLGGIKLYKVSSQFLPEHTYVQYFAKNSLRQTRKHSQPVCQMRLMIVIILEVYGLFEV